VIRPTALRDNGENREGKMMDNTTLTDDLIAEIEGCRFTCETIGFHYVVKTLDRAAAELRSLRDLVGPIEGKGKTIHHEGRMYYPAEMVNRLIAELRSMRAENAHLASWKAGHMAVSRMR